MTTSLTEDKTKVFISYSRADSIFAESLVDDLHGVNIDAFLDVHDIVKGEPWKQRLQGLIASADAIVFLLSSDSVASEVCEWEVKEAEVLGKKILPVVCRATDNKIIPQSLSRLNFTFLDGSKDNQVEFEGLVAAITQNLQWVRLHTSLYERALQWRHRGNASDQLLRGDYLSEAERWLVENLPSQMSITRLHQDYINTSREGARRRHRILVTSLGAGLVLALVLGGIAAWQGIIASQQRDQAMESWVAANASRSEMMSNESPVIATLLAIESLPTGGDRQIPYKPNAERALYSALSKMREVAVMRGHSTDVMSVAFSPNGKHLATGDASGIIQMWETGLDSPVLKINTHHVAINHVEFSYDGKKIITSGYDGKAILWDVDSGKKITEFVGHTGIVSRAHFDSASSRALTISVDSTVRLWDMESGQEIAMFRSASNGYSMALNRISHTGVIIRDDGSLAIIDITDGKIIHTLSIPNQQAVSLDLSLNGKTLSVVFFDGHVGFYHYPNLQLIRDVAGNEAGTEGVVMFPNGLAAIALGKDGKAVLWGVNTGIKRGIGKENFTQQTQRQVMPAATAEFFDVTISSDNRMFVFQGQVDSKLKLWLYDVVMDEWVEEFDRPSHDVFTAGTSDRSPLAVAFSPTEELFVAAYQAVSNEGGIAVLNNSKPNIGHEVWLGHSQALTDLQISPDNSRLVTTSFDTNVVLWKYPEGKLLSKLTAHTDEVLSVEFNPNGENFVTGSLDGTAIIWNTINGEMLSVLDGGSVKQRGAVFFSIYSSNGQLIATGPNDGYARIWNASDGTLIGKCEALGRDGFPVAPLSAAFSPVGNVLALGDEKGITLWNSSDCTLIRTLIGHDKGVLSLAFSSDGTSLISTSTDTTVRRWDVATGAQLEKYAHTAAVRRVVILRDEEHFVSGADDGTIRIWSIGSTEARHTLFGHTKGITDLSLSPDGKRLVSSSFDGKVRVWDIEQGEELATLGESDIPVSSVIFDHEGKYIVSGSSDDVAKIWQLHSNVEQVVKYAQNRVPRCLTKLERVTYALPKAEPSWCKDLDKWPYKQLDKIQ